jgi:hypothetical protein
VLEQTKISVKICGITVCIVFLCHVPRPNYPLGV